VGIQGVRLMNPYHQPSRNPIFMEAWLRPGSDEMVTAF